MQFWLCKNENGNFVSYSNSEISNLLISIERKAQEETDWSYDLKKKKKKESNISLFTGEEMSFEEKGCLTAVDKNDSCRIVWEESALMGWQTPGTLSLTIC